MKVKKKSLVVATLLGAAALLVAACGGSDKTTVISGGAAEHAISVSGQGITYAQPDIADITVGVQVTEQTVAGARNTAATAQDAVKKSLTANGIDDKDIRTTDFRIDPQYDYVQNRQVLRGYQVSNTFTVRVRKLDTLGKVIDDATAAGGNNTIIRSIAFSILDPSKQQAEARDLAVKDAKSRADVLARTGGVKLGKVISISEGGSSVVPPQPLSAVAAAPRAASDVATTIESGQLKVQINVSVVYAIE